MSITIDKFLFEEISSCLRWIWDNLDSPIVLKGYHTHTQKNKNTNIQRNKGLYVNQQK